MTFSPAQPKESLSFRTALCSLGLGSDLVPTVRQWGFSNGTAAAWPLANLAFYIPFQVDERCIAYEVFWSTGTGTGGNADIGIYDMAGNRLVSLGSTARGSASSWINTNWTDYTIEPGQYYMAMAANGVEGYLAYAVTAGCAEACGVCEQQTAFALPATATLARTTRAYIPLFGFNLRSVAM